ncbi:MAG TPA: M28 family peptidase [Bacteroidia bacterium]|nr:M28 family peptidase [Bacteroidia bacterium]
MRLLLFSALHFLSLPAFAQDKTYARQVIDTLASPSMHGRGYVNNGDKIASAYIAGEYKSFGLLSFNIPGNYFQDFSFPVNTFPGNVELTFQWQDGKKQKGFTGEDFLVRGESPSVKGSFKVIRLDSTVVYDNGKWELFKNTNLKKHFVLVDTSGVRNRKQLSYMTDFVKYPRNVKGILLPVKNNVVEGSHDCSKLTPLGMSYVQSTIPVVEIAREFATATAIDICIGAKFLKKYTSRNVIGYIKGNLYPDSFIVFTAHYDHLGRMGKDAYFPGANDNASGVAMLLSLARYYAKPENKPRCSIVFIAFSAEEVGLLGSGHFTRQPLFPLKAIRFLVNMDILGTGDEGITVVNATLQDSTFKKLKALNEVNNYLVLVKPRGPAAISDHHFFTEAKVPCFYIYTLGGIKAYHDTCDRRETLPLTEFEDLFKLLRDFTGWIDSK